MRAIIHGLMVLCLISTGFACSGTRVITAAEMQARNAPPEPAVEEPAEVAWNGGWFSLDEEFELPYPRPWKLQGGDLIIRLDRCEWVTFGESRQAWAHVTVSLNGQDIALRVSEGEVATAHGYRFECTHAFEKWDEDSQEYFHNSRFKISR